MLRKGEWVWVPSNIGVPIGARVKVTPSGQRFLVDDEGKEQKLSMEEETSLKIMHATSVEGVEDMIKLGDMTEAGVLRNLLLRHKQGKIYTYTGSVLVAVNPYKVFPIYSNDQIKLYHGRKLGELPPHIFAIAESCYFNMKRRRMNQCCIISGESGAGKTEGTKLILQYLAAISGAHSEQQIEQQILESNPLLEAFGNAKTIRNDNSSRFGKYLEIFFNKDGVIEGARIEQYLLEKSRVCHQAHEERNYHVFYSMLAGLSAEERKSLGLKGAEEYACLSKGNCITCEGRGDAEDYKRIRSAMKILTFSDKQCYEIFKLLAAILHLGNMSFEANTLNNLDTSDVSKSEHVGIAASLLEVQKSLLASSLTHRSFMTVREKVTKPLSSEQASDCRDAFVKAIYNKLFVWIVEKINSVTYKKMSSTHKSAFHSIGLLDIFGFENFKTNSFEQLCINFANEKLQQFFVGHIFKLEQKEYMKEDIVWNNISFSDNQNILDLLAGKSCNLLALIDEESHFPKGSDLTMLNKMNQQHSGNKNYIASKTEHDLDFAVRHFAGVVHYESSGFLEKNRDDISSDIFKMVEASKNKLLRQIFESDLSTNGLKIPKNVKVIMTPKSSLRVTADTRKQMPTLSGQFRQSLDSLMKALSSCQPYFIRCFKPNNEKQSEVFDRELCMRQMRYSGMMDTIRIRKLGFPIRHKFEDFLARYRVLLKTTVCNPKTATAAACCEAICKTVISETNEWKMGRTKVFVKDAHDAVLERLREQELSRIAVVIQRVMMGYKDRKSFVRKRRASVVLQRRWRAYQKEKERKKIQQGFDRLTAKIRSRLLRLWYQRQKMAALTLQTQVRGYLARKDLKQKRQAVLLLQAHTRGLLARREFGKIRSNATLARQQREIEDQMALDIQRRLEEVIQSHLDETETELSDQEEPEENENMIVLLSRTSRVEEEVDKSSPAENDLQMKAVVDELDQSYLDDSETGRMVNNMPEPDSEGRISVSSHAPSTSPSLDEEDDEFDDGSDELSFQAFSRCYFQDDTSPSHITQRLRKPLLKHDDEGETLACLTAWWIILRFMGDLPEPKAPDTVSQSSSTISPQLPSRQGRRLSHLVGLDQKLLRKNKKKSANRRASAILEEPEDEEDGDILIGEGPTLHRPLTALEKVHIIVGYALSRQGIRDEIYCQICKQLVNNRNRQSCTQGWILLSLCLGIFPPSDLLMKYLENFVRKGPAGYGAYCSALLRRIIANGERKELPCWIELQAVKAKELIDVSVSLMDGNEVRLRVDSASTSAEVCQAVADKIQLRDKYGFSLYISLHDKMWSLGSCGKHVLDAVSQCEQEMRRQGKEERDATWKLSLRKELFTPWHDCSEDGISTNLIYRQVVKGMKSGDYTSEKEDEYVQLAQQHYYVQFGSELNRANVQKVVEECINTTLIENKSMGRWIQLISAAHSQNLDNRGMVSREKVKEEFVDSARKKWPLFFSKFYEVTLISGPSLPKNRFVAAVNWSGIFFMDGRDKKLLEIPYVELKDIQYPSPFGPQSVSLATVRGEFVLRCAEASEMAALMDENLNGLRKRSVYAVAQHEVSRTDDPKLLACRRGDLLLLSKSGKEYLPENVVSATNQKTDLSGEINRNVLHILPTLTVPTDEMLELHTPGHRKSSITQVSPLIPHRDETVAPISLKEFAMENFRSPGKDLGRHGAGRGLSREKLWACSREPLKQPLMKNLAGNSDLNYLAVNAFTAIMKYMGDYPIKQVRSPIELTNQIFGPATKHEELQDEIYCQIMRQMTSNSNRLSVERGWQLMWLCSGLFPPSRDLMPHTKRFLESRPRDPLAALCLRRLQRMCSKESRKLPPHPVEVDAIQQNSTQIFHKVHFPNDTDDIFEVTSTTTIQDLCHSIATQLNLSSADGYGLYLKTPNKVHSLDEQKYFFDSLRQTAEAPKKGKRVKEATSANMPYLVICKRKLWFNVSPGKDLVADLTFHFPQELPKYLRGYHTCTKEDMIKLAGLLFRTQVDSDRTQFVMIPKMLQELVPADQVQLMSAEEWKKHIISSYNKQSGITVQEAKISFLQAISTWPTFGCTFFEVKQTCEPDYPSRLLIAISKQGVSLTDPQQKELLVMHPFSRITEYLSRGSHFQMTIGTLVRGVIFVCETTQGSTMEDLVRSYISMYEKQRRGFRSTNHMFH